MTLIWAIVFGSTILFIPPILYLSIKSGYITTLFKSAQRRLTSPPNPSSASSPTSAPTPSPSPTIQDTLNYDPKIDYSLEYNEYKNASAPFQSTRFQVRPDSNKDEMNELTDMFRNIGRLHGGKLIFNKKRKNKTRKHKKSKTKKLKVRNKRRCTRNKNGVRSKRR